MSKQERTVEYTQCDGCDKEISLLESIGEPEKNKPIHICSWGDEAGVAIGMKNYSVSEEQFDFCDLDCLVKFFKDTYNF